MVGYPSKFVVLTPFCLDPSHGLSDGVSFGRFDLAALSRLPHLKCLFVCCRAWVLAAMSSGTIVSVMFVLNKA